MKRKDFHLHKTEKYLGMSFMFLSAALVFYISAFAWVELQSPEDPLARVVSQQGPLVLGSRNQREVDRGDQRGRYFLISNSLDRQGQIAYPRNYFGEEVEAVYFEVGLQSQNHSRVSLRVHYLEDGKSGAEVPILEEEVETLLQQPAVQFELHRPGASWQLKGIFRAVAQVYSAEDELIREEEQVFEIY